MDFIEESRKKHNGKLDELVEDYFQNEEIPESLRPLMREAASFFYWYGMEDGAELCVETAKERLNQIGKV